MEGTFFPSICYSHGKGGNYGKDHADRSRMFTGEQDPEEVFTAVFLSDAAALTENANSGIIKTTERSQNSLCSKKGAKHGTSEE